jgi:hypothetical protein
MLSKYGNHYLGLLMLRRLLGISFRAIRVTARNTSMVVWLRILPFFNASPRNLLIWLSNILGNSLR